MATNLNISENQERVPLTIGSSGVLRSITPDNGSPYYVGARAYVTQTASGATVTVIDKDGTTTAVILNGTNGIDGQDGADGADGNGIASIDLTSTVGNVDTYTITYTDGTTDTFEITNGVDGQDGQDGADGADGADGFSPIATVSKVGDTATITITDANGTTTANISDGTDGVDGTDGTDGVDGFSPIATVTKSGDTATISITDENGTTTATVSDGADGQDGRDGTDGTDGEDGVGIVSITKTATVGLVDTYTILYSDGTTSTFDVTNGQNGSGSVADVWVDGVSVLDDDTAKIDLTGKSDVGHTHTKSAITDFPTDVSSFVNDSGYITSPNVVYCTCSTAAGTAAKVATIESGTFTSLNKGDQAIVKFTNANSASSPTLQVGTTTAKSIKRYGTTAPSTSAATSWNAGSAVLFVYDGTYWQQIGFLNTTYSEISSSNITDGTSSGTGLITGRRAKGAVEEFAPVKDVTVGGTSVLSGTTAVVPAIPTVNDATLTIQKNGTNVQTFTANASSNVTANITVPTDTGDLTNGAGFITSNDIPVTDVTMDGSSVVTSGVAEFETSSLIDIFYPVGSYYETSDTSFNPNIAWSGTWVLETEGQVHISGSTNGTYQVDGAPTDTNDGGSPTSATNDYTLKIADIPSHNHNSKTLTGSMRVMAWSSATASGIVSMSNQDKNRNPGSGSNEGAATFTINATHTHDSQGGGGAHNHGNVSTMQPYIVVNRWHRTA